MPLPACSDKTTLRTSQANPETLNLKIMHGLPALQGVWEKDEARKLDSFQAFDEVLAIIQQA